MLIAACSIMYIPCGVMQLLRTRKCLPHSAAPSQPRAFRIKTSVSSWHGPMAGRSFFACKACAPHFLFPRSWTRPRTIGRAMLLLHCSFAKVVDPCARVSTHMLFPNVKQSFSFASRAHHELAKVPQPQRRGVWIIQDLPKGLIIHWMSLCNCAPETQPRGLCYAL